MKSDTIYHTVAENWKLSLEPLVSSLTSASTHDAEKFLKPDNLTFAE